MRTVTFILVILIILFVFSFNSGGELADETLDVINVIKEKVSSIFSGIGSSLTSCPQVNVTIKDESWKGLNIGGESFDGWVVKGDGECRKGSKEGENLNYYYCGGYVNAYVEKTTIHGDGTIGETKKYVIWNKYDENMNFISTSCLGDPDEYEEEQIKEFEKYLMSWH